MQGYPQKIFSLFSFILIFSFLSPNILIEVIKLSFFYVIHAKEVEGKKKKPIEIKKSCLR